MRVLNKLGFKLPYLGMDTFKELTRLGIGYERGLFFVTDLNNIEKIMEILSEVLDQKIVFTQTCLICEREVLCMECQFHHSCSSRNLPLHCVCKSCFEMNDLYERYIEKCTQEMRRLLSSLK